MGTNALESALPAAFEVARRALGARREDVEAPLGEALYRDWYCAVGSKPAAHGEDRDLSELLRAAHAGSCRWEDGWRVANVSSRGRVAVRRGRERRVVHIIDCITAEGRGADVRPGDVVCVVARRDSESMNPGDWVTFSEAWHASRLPAVRVYWNVMPSGAPRLVRSLTQALDDAFPFLLKCPRRPAEYDRRDAGVLYLPRRRFVDAGAAIAEAAKAAGGALQDPVPPLTKRLAPGVGVAEDPLDVNESFGISRCGLVARGIAACIAEGRTGSVDWMSAVVSAFSAAGVSAERPWADAMGGPEYSLP